MKHTLSILAAIISVAMFVSSCNSTQSTQASAQVAPSGEIAPAGSIVYIQMDSLVNQYDMFNDLKSEFESKVEAIQDDLRKKSNAFEKSATDFQNKLNKGLLTRSQAETQQQALMQREQELRNLSQQKQMEMQEEEAVMLRRVMDAIQTYLNSYNETHNYALILTTSGASSTVIVGNPSLDITNDVLKGLNEEYIQSKK
ncbi:MAG: OmpH family outer membrane protein [Bacteroidales bacterium]|nr:OmpH family outer membrane protein [Bacteroidales bacterium]MBQ3522717.1 OmpH family outer membrane protein [Bacteroidales bacterium]MBQ8035184.1 OmpH family outer membrane protein [Bacteroidales bacterium]MBR4094782.1 OmpH family outer membrane protein [Bacteroidales bacterium]